MPFLMNQSKKPTSVLDASPAATPSTRGSKVSAGAGYAVQKAALSPDHGSAAGTGTGAPAEALAKVAPGIGRNVTGKPGAYVDPDRTGSNGVGRLPYVGNNPRAWDGAEILKHWSQQDAQAYTLSDEFRCGSNALLAPRILAGPEALMKFLGKLAKEAHLLSTTPDFAHLKEPTAVLTFCALALYNGFGTYEHLDFVADAVKKIALGGPKVASDAADVSHYHTYEADEAKGDPTGQLINAVPNSKADVDLLCRFLKPNMAWMVNVDSNPLKKGQTKSVDDVDHFITVGKDSKGKVYLYDPAPRSGTQMVYKKADSDTFYAYFMDPGGKMRYSEWLNRTTPKA